MRAQRGSGRGEAGEIIRPPLHNGQLGPAANRNIHAASLPSNVHTEMTRRSNRARSGPGTVRIIGGEWRGRRLEFPASAQLRPTPDRVRETLFNWLAAWLPGARCVDLYAGTGCLGFEALSRGAAEVWLVERDPALVRALQQHAARLGADARIVRDDARRFLAAPPARFDIVFLDPPYRDAVEPLLDALGAALAPRALVYVERPLPSGLPRVAAAEWVKRSRAGGVEFGLLRFSPPAERPVEDRER
jgi:16S rRNA (guanine966-N2)-methyltransferase